jgi:TPR repeat protein
VRPPLPAIALLLLGAVLAAPVVASQGEAAASGPSAADVAELRNIAAAGNAQAQFLLGGLYYHGEGVPQDLAEAARLYRLAADQGNAEAQNAIGFQYLQGMGAARDDAQAAYWFGKAAEQGHPGALTHLGRLSLSGRGVTRDVAEAARLFKLAAEQGVPQAQRMLRLLYATSPDLGRGKLFAYMWADIAARADPKLATTRDAIANPLVGNPMPAAEVKAAQALADRCIARKFDRCEDG